MKELDQSRYKVKRLSDYKIQLEYEIPIFASNSKDLIIIHKFKVKSKYRLDPLELRKSGQKPLYHQIPIKDRFLQLISQNWKIKKKNILLQNSHHFYTIGEFQIHKLYSGFIFYDPTWFRDYQLRNILN
jgi:hypothetical protein